MLPLTRRDLRKRASILALLASSCHSAAPAVPEPEAPTSTEVQVAGAQRSEPSVADSAPSFDPALARAVAWRGLSPKRAVTQRVLPREQFSAEMLAVLRRDLPQDVNEGQTRFLALLGLVPPSFDLFETMSALSRDAVAGFYDPVSATLFVAADLPPRERERALVHEWVHALQDQHYGLARAVQRVPGLGDVQAALHALAEGDATLAVLQAELDGESLPEMLRSLPSSLAQQHPDIPAVVRRSIVATYVDGFRLVRSAWRRGGWASVDRMWRDPPLSTEHVLHPEKYAAREAWEPRPPAPVPAPGCTLAYWEVLGEQAIRLMLEEWVSEASAALAAEGWNGDRLELFACGGSPTSPNTALVPAFGHALTLRIGADTARDRDELLQALQQRFGSCSEPRAALVRSAPPNDVVLTASDLLDCSALERWSSHQTP